MNLKDRDILKSEAIDLLTDLIKIPSISENEERTADRIESYLQLKGVETQRKYNNVWCKNRYFNPLKKTILLNSHHDTVSPNNAYSFNPFEPHITDGKLFGLGSNDAGGCLVSLLSTFLHFYQREDLKYNLIYVASAEEENSGTRSIRSLLPELGDINFGIVGEPTEMHLAVAEKGLMVLDCEIEGEAGHAARERGENAIYKALNDIQWFQTYQFPKISKLLGAIKMTVTMIEGGTQHNVVPDRCHLVVDVRTNDSYTSNEEVLKIIKEHVSCVVTPRSTRIQPSSLRLDHPFALAGKKIGRTLFGSPTTSDQAQMRFETVKIGPGDSNRSHTPDEFIYLSEIEEGIDLYIKILSEIV